MPCAHPFAYNEIIDMWTDNDRQKPSEKGEKRENERECKESLTKREWKVRVIDTIWRETDRERMTNWPRENVRRDWIREKRKDNERLWGETEARI